MSHTTQELREMIAALEEQIIELAEQNRRLWEEFRWLRRVIHRILEIDEPHLSKIQIHFRKGTSMPNPGPVTLTSAGQTAQAVIVGFDQFGNPWTGEIPAATYAVDNAAIATVDASGLVTAVANGTANLTGSLTTAEGLALSDTEQVIVSIAPPPTPVLSAIKVQFQ